MTHGFHIQNGNQNQWASPSMHDPEILLVWKRMGFCDSVCIICLHVFFFMSAFFLLRLWESWHHTHDVRSVWRERIRRFRWDADEGSHMTTHSMSQKRWLSGFSSFSLKFSLLPYPNWMNLTVGKNRMQQEQQKAWTRIQNYCSNAHVYPFFTLLMPVPLRSCDQATKSKGKRGSDDKGNPDEHESLVTCKGYKKRATFSSPTRTITAKACQIAKHVSCSQFYLLLRPLGLYVFQSESIINGNKPAFCSSFILILPNSLTILLWSRCKPEHDDDERKESKGNGMPDQKKIV